MSQPGSNSQTKSDSGPTTRSMTKKASSGPPPRKGDSKPNSEQPTPVPSMMSSKTDKPKSSESPPSPFIKRKSSLFTAWIPRSQPSFSKQLPIVHPNDSISNVSSNKSSAKSFHLLAVAKKTKLNYQAKLLREQSEVEENLAQIRSRRIRQQQLLDEEERAMKRQLQQLEIENSLKLAKVEADAYHELDSRRPSAAPSLVTTMPPASIKAIKIFTRTTTL